MAQADAATERRDLREADRAPERKRRCDERRAISRMRSAPTSASEPVEDVGGDGGALDAEVLDEEHEHEQAEEDIEQEQ